MSIATSTAPTKATDLSLTRLHLIRAGFLLMGVGLALAVTPWRYVWRSHVLAPGDRWR